jgi:hypothetical protein
LRPRVLLNVLLARDSVRGRRLLAAIEDAVVWSSIKGNRLDLGNLLDAVDLRFRCSREMWIAYQWARVRIIWGPCWSNGERRFVPVELVITSSGKLTTLKEENIPGENGTECEMAYFWFPEAWASMVKVVAKVVAEGARDGATGTAKARETIARKAIINSNSPMADDWDLSLWMEVVVGVRRKSPRVRIG